MILALLAPQIVESQRSLYVNAATGNDSVSRANNSATSPWRSIGRAAWGSTSRGTPSPSEAAAAGDTVLIAGGTYAFSGAVTNRFESVYNPANSGSSGSPISFVCTGQCVLEAPQANSPVIGASSRNFVKWFADVGAGHSWAIQACGRTSGCASNTVNTTADTGPVVCHAATGCWVEGAVIDGGLGIDYADNWNAVRIENCTSCTIRNNDMRNFTRDAVAGNTNHNQSIITLYGSLNSVVEHNVGTNAGSGVYFKDTGSSNPQSGNIIRFNRFDNVGEAFAFSITAEDRNFIYQNVATNGQFGVAIVGGGLSNDWIFNNTFYRMAQAGISGGTSGSGGRFWNNICVDCDRMIYVNGGVMFSEAVLDLEHNVYFDFTQFYTGTDGNRTFASYLSAYPTQDQASPVSLVADPLFAGAGSGDFRLCTGASLPSSTCTGSSPALARGIDFHDLDRDGNTLDTIRVGAYVNDSDTIGRIAGQSNSAPGAPTNFQIVVTP